MAQEKILTSVQDAYDAYVGDMVSDLATYDGEPFNLDRAQKDSAWGWWLPTSPKMVHVESDTLVEVTMIDIDERIQRLRDKYDRTVQVLRGHK